MLEPVKCIKNLPQCYQKTMHLMEVILHSFRMKHPGFVNWYMFEGHALCMQPIESVSRPI